MIDFDAVYAALAQRINDIIDSRRAGTLRGDDLIDALTAWDADCQEAHTALHRQTENMLTVYRLYTGACGD